MRVGLTAVMVSILGCSRAASGFIVHFERMAWGDFGRNIYLARRREPEMLRLGFSRVFGVTQSGRLSVGPSEGGGEAVDLLAGTACDGTVIHGAGGHVRRR